MGDNRTCRRTILVLLPLAMSAATAVAGQTMEGAAGPCPYDPDNDLDGDGVCGDVDNCPYHSNTDQADCDDDGIGDVCAIAECPPGNLACRDCDDNDRPDACDTVSTSPIEIAKLTGENAEQGDWFGWSVAIHGETLVAGALDDGVGPLSGSATVFRRIDRAWGPEIKLTSEDAEERDVFGRSVSIDRDVILIGARWDDDNGVDSGSAYVFRFDGGTWVEEGKLTASDAAPGDQFGQSVSIWGDTATVGARYNDENGDAAGAAYMFHFDGQAWEEEGKLTPSDAAAHDVFGTSVATSGNITVVGAPSNDDVCPSDVFCDSGSAYVFRYSGITWAQDAKLTASDAREGDGFGRSVALAVAGDRIVVGTPGADVSASDSGAAYVFRFDGNAWVEEARLAPEDAERWDSFGTSVSVSKDTVLVGSPGADDAGSAYAFRFDGSTWIQSAKVTPLGGAPGDSFGGSVSLHDDTVVIGASADDGACPGLSQCNSGMVYVYELAPGDCNDDAIPDRCQAGDMDANGLIEIADFSDVNRCITGPATPGLDLGECCSMADFEDDGHVDLRDIASFQRAFTGP